MTKTEIQTALESVPEEMKDVHPREIKEYFQNTYSELTESEINILTANYVYSNLSQLDQNKPWEGLKIEVSHKYSNIREYDLSELYPWLRLVHAQSDSGLTVIGVEN